MVALVTLQRQGCSEEVVAEYNYGSTEELGKRGLLDDFPESLLQMTDTRKHSYQCSNLEAAAYRL